MSCSSPQCVLAIDDSPVVLTLIETRLRPEGVRFVTAASGEEGLAAVAREKPDLVLLDVEMPGLGGLDVCRRLKSNPATANIPVIFLTATDDVSIKVVGFDLGAHDYVMKPFHPEELRARVRAALRMKRSQDLLFREAQVDALTGYRTRAYIEGRLRDEIAIAVRDRRPLSIVRIELDHLRSLVDTFGHPFGDAVLQRVSGFAARSIPDQALACRFGGDELLFLLPNTYRPDAEAIARAIREGVRGMAMASRGRRVVVTLTASVVEALEVEATRGSVDVPALLAASELEIRSAKREGRDRVRGGTGALPLGLQGPEESRADRESDARAGTVLLEKYVVDRKIGQGGMGTVYRAMHLERGEPVAVKFLRDIWRCSEEHNARFRREALLLARLRHPGIVSILDFGELEDEPFMVMELVQGRTLDVVARDGVLSRPRISRIFRQLIDVLSVAHREHVVHRDMKPENVMLVDNGDDDVKVLDFGIALVADRAGGRRLTRTGECRGTAHYMAPEQWAGTGVGPEADVYALGVMLFESLAGRLPFDADELPSLMVQHVFGEIPDLPNPTGGAPPSPALRDLVRRMLAKNADERPTTTELRVALPALLEDGAETLPCSASRANVGEAVLALVAG